MSLRRGICGLRQQTKENVCLRRNNEADISSHLYLAILGTNLGTMSKR